MEPQQSIALSEGAEEIVFEVGKSGDASEYVHNPKEEHVLNLIGLNFTDKEIEDWIVDIENDLEEVEERLENGDLEEDQYIRNVITEIYRNAWKTTQNLKNYLEHKHETSGPYTYSSGEGSIDVPQEEEIPDQLLETLRIEDYASEIAEDINDQAEEFGWDSEYKITQSHMNISSYLAKKEYIEDDE